MFWFEIRFGFDFNKYGVYPKTWKGLRGIFFSPFIHGDITHLWHNTLPLLILSASLFFFYAKNAWKVLTVGLLLTGLGTWLFGRASYHIGASGIIYLLFGFLFLKGILAKHFRLIAVSLLVVFIYGGMVWYIAPIDPKISWEGHLSGLISGILLAFFIKKGIATAPKFVWESPEFVEEEDEFLKHFDENGNFIERLPEETTSPDIEEIRIYYEYKRKSLNEEEE